MAAMWFLIQWLRKKVRWLVIHSDMVDTSLFSLNVVPEMMKFDIEVFRPRPILVNSGHFECSAVVLEYSTMYSGLRLQNRIISPLYLLQTVPSLGLRLWGHNSGPCICFPSTIEPLLSAVEISTTRGSRRNWLCSHVVTSQYHNLCLPP